MYKVNDFPHTAKVGTRGMARRQALLVVGREVVCHGLTRSRFGAQSG